MAATGGGVGAPVACERGDGLTLRFAGEGRRAGERRHAGTVITRRRRGWGHGRGPRSGGTPSRMGTSRTRGTGDDDTKLRQHGVRGVSGCGGQASGVGNASGRREHASGDEPGERRSGASESRHSGPPRSGWLRRANESRDRDDRLVLVGDRDRDHRSSTDHRGRESELASRIAGEQLVDQIRPVASHTVEIAKRAQRVTPCRVNSCSNRRNARCCSTRTAPTRLPSAAAVRATSRPATNRSINTCA